MKLDLGKLVMAVLTMLVTGLGYFVWDLHAWKASMGDFNEVTFVKHIGEQELKNQQIVLLFKLNGVEAGKVTVGEVSP